jgi:TatA/E family protein of Tat protein translocase
MYPKIFPLSKGDMYDTINFISYKPLRIKEDEMFGIGMTELLVILGLALLLIGPKKLPQLAKSLGKTLGELRKATDDLKETISEEIEPIKNEIPDRGELEKALKKKFLEGEEEEEQESKAGKGPQTK